MALQETHPRELQRIGPTAWAARRRFSCPTAEMQGHVSSLWQTGYPGFSGRALPVAYKIQADPNGDSLGRSSIVVHYQTLTNDEYMERHPSKGVVYVRGGSRTESLTTDANGLLMVGTDPDDASGQTEWKVDRGPDGILKPNVSFVVHAFVASKTIYVDQFIDDIGRVNSNLMTRLGQYGSSAGELLFYRLDAQPSQFNKSHYVVDYHFLWTGAKGLKWDQLAVSRKWEKRALTVPLLDASGAATGNTRGVYGLAPTSSTRTATLYESSNFMPIDLLCQW